MSLYKSYFYLLGPGFEEKSRRLPSGSEELSFVRLSDQSGVSFVTVEILREAMSGVGFGEQDCQWDSPDGLAAVGAIFDGLFVSMVSVGIFFDTPDDPRGWVEKIEIILGDLGFRYTANVGASSPRNQVEASLACEYWRARKASGAEKI
jgi:hypothetical protein